MVEEVEENADIGTYFVNFQYLKAVKAARFVCMYIKEPSSKMLFFFLPETNLHRRQRQRII